VLPQTANHILHSDKQTAYLSARRAYWDDFAAQIERWQKMRRYYQRRLAEIYSFLIPPGMRVLEIGSGTGDLLAAVRPTYGVGIDLSPGMINYARQHHPELRFIEADVHSFDLGEKFDYIICSDTLNDLWDVQRAFDRVRAHCDPSTRVVINSYRRVWEIPRKIAEAIGVAKPMLPQNWLMAADIENLLYLSNLEVVRSSQEILSPLYIPLLSSLANRYLAKLWPFSIFALTNLVIARPQQERRKGPEPVVSVVVAARNEEGNIPQIFDRMPQLGGGTELIFVEGNSTDDTYGAIAREIERRPGMNAKLFKQPGKGKGDAVRAGFREASGEVLMILDADLTVPPEDLPLFYEAWRSGKADLVNGVRLVYPMEQRAMRFFNHLANRFFSFAFSWLFNQSVKDTLCGTKVLSRQDYSLIAANRSYFGDFDPFGDFDLLFGAAKYNLKIVDLPIRYAERTYGDTNIQRWRHGFTLLRMALLAMRRIKFV